MNGKKVLLRSGFDVDIVKGEIVDERRIKAGLPTILYLLEHGAQTITVVNHIGRPAGKVDMTLSNQPVAERVRELVGSDKSGVYIFQKQNNFAPAAKFSSPSPYQSAQGGTKPDRVAGCSSRHIPHSLSQINFLENIRFDPREEKNDRSLGQELAKDQDIFVQDAFSNCHRRHASMAAVTEFLPSYAGLLVEKEYQNLSKLLKNPVKPLVVIIGGVKVETKVPVIDYIKPLADWVLIGGEVANEVKARRLFENDKKIVLPVDGIVDPSGHTGDIGPKTVELFRQKIQTAQTIFWNGNLGKTEDPRFATGSKAVGACLADQDGFTVAGGGDTAALLDELGIADKFDYISTAGGASLVYLSGSKMPGLDPLFA